jgi:hypothetical protein
LGIGFTVCHLIFALVNFVVWFRPK